MPRLLVHLLIPLVLALPTLAAAATSSDAGSNCLALLGGRLDARWGIPLAIVAGGLVAWALVVVIRRLLKA
jgi:hypothetical protein